MTIWVPVLSNETTSKYEAIADAIAEGIADGTLAEGQKLPPQRQLAQKLSVTVGTIGRAYSLAENRGLVTLEVGRGSFVRSHETRFNGADHRRDVIDLGVNLPPMTENIGLLSRTLSQISNSRNVANLFGSAPVEPLEHHTVAAVEWLGDRVKCSESNVLIASGTQTVLIASLGMLTKPGDFVMVGELTFPGMLTAARFLRLNLIPLKMDGEGIVPSEIERESKRSRVLYCVPTNQNPTTATMSASRRADIAKIVESSNVNIIEDDVYGKLVENAPPAIVNLAPKRTILISSLSKTLSVGLRLAFVCVPEAFRAPLKSNLIALNFFPSPLLCEIASSWITDGTAERLLLEQRQVAIRRQSIAKSILEEQAIRGDPKGNHIWVSLPSAWSSETLERAAIENGVNVYAASAFTNESPYPNAIRIALGAARNDSELKIGLNKIARLLDQASPHPVPRF